MLLLGCWGGGAGFFFGSAGTRVIHAESFLGAGVLSSSPLGTVTEDLTVKTKSQWMNSLYMTILLH